MVLDKLITPTSLNPEENLGRQVSQDGKAKKPTPQFSAECDPMSFVSRGSFYYLPARASRIQERTLNNEQILRT